MNPLSSSTNWLDNYNQDSNVPDPYAQTNQVENVAQNTVVDSFNLNVPGLFASVEPGWQKIFHQFATLQTSQREAGDLLVPGRTCTERLTSSAPVPQAEGSMRWVGKQVVLASKPDIALAAGIKVIPDREFSTEAKCQLHW